MKIFYRLVFSVLLLFSAPLLRAQPGEEQLMLNYADPKEYVIAKPVEFRTKENSALDQSILRMLTGLNEGDKIMVPGDKISSAIETLWKQGLFTHIEINAAKIEGDKIFLEVYLEERPRLKAYTFRGAKRNEVDDLREQLKLIKGKPVDDNLMMNIKTTATEFFIEKGYLNAEVTVDNESKNDTLIINIRKNRRIKIKAINIAGNTAIKTRKLKKKMKNTRENPWYSIFTTSKYMEDNYIEDKKKIIALYNEKGYKDARIVKDTVYRFDDRHINIDITIDEGPQYFFRNITWIGNAKYTSKQLSDILGIRKGDVYNQAVLAQNLNMNQSETDISSLYMNDGHLFFQVNPVETFVNGDSVDIEIRIYEGKQATINRVTVVGNEKTNDHVILREVRTKPGQLFRRSDIMRTLRELQQLGYFNPEKMDVNPVPDPASGTVDIEYRVEEKPSDQLQLSGGWGAGRLIGNLGVAFNNFSARKFFKKGAWQPLPSGDGQRLSVNASSTGPAFQSYNLSFTEPWLGGKRPNSLTVTLYHSNFGNGLPKADPNKSLTKNTGLILGYGRRLKWPDDWFTLQHSLSYQYYELKNSTAFDLSNGFANNISFTTIFSRNSIDDPIFPKSGSNISLSLQFTPPYSFFSNRSDSEQMTMEQRYKWVEFHKWKFDAQWFLPLTKNKNALVLMTRANFGFVGIFDSRKGLSPFERFRFGGTGLNGLNWGAQLLGAEIIGLRGYDDQSISQTATGNFTDAPIYNRYTMELRFPVSLNPSAMVYALSFLEGGNAWTQFRNFDPFSVKRSAGAGVRVFLPMFGLLGLDFAVPFDNDKIREGLRIQKTWIHFIIGQNFN